MAAGRSFKSFMGRRRRAEDEGEDEVGDVIVEDSQSDGSILSDGDEDEADVSSLGGPDVHNEGDTSTQQPEVAVTGAKAPGKKARKSRKKGAKKPGKDLVSESSPIPQTGGFKAPEDTQAMLNGLKVNQEAAQDVVDYETIERNEGAMATQPVIAVSNNEQRPIERQRREPEETRRQHDRVNPTAIPSRGNFFMHDTRGNQGQSGSATRGGWPSRGRGRGGLVANAGGHFLPGHQSGQGERAAEQPWKHDLHDTINEEPLPTHTAAAMNDNNSGREGLARQLPKASTNQLPPQQARVISFSSTTTIGKVQIRVFLPGKYEPKLFYEVPWKHYTRLPDHRPPLRRDKPVRVSLPGHTQRHIFPSAERSFIFIPRQMRPNQQGFGRGSYQRSVGGYGYSSRRTSVYGGSTYAASVAASRRSSFASVARENAFSPVGSYAGGMPPTRPIVRLPHGSHGQFSASSTPAGPLSGHQTPTGMQMHTFPLPGQPWHESTATTQVHQPRPQKVISVTGIESPAALQQAPGQQAPAQPASVPSESLPFQNQLPAHMVEQTALSQNPSQAYFSPRQNFAHPQQPQAGTPLSGIPEQAIHAPSFHPPVLPYNGAPYYGPYQGQQQNFYYPPGPNTYQHVPLYVPPPQGYSMPPQPADQQQRAPLQAQHVEPEQTQSQQQLPSQSGMVAHESNGMVFYLPASEAQQQPSSGGNYQPAESFVPAYAMPGLPPPTPAPSTAFYYPPSMPGYYSGQPQHP